jgi:hypothetical protein
MYRRVVLSDTDAAHLFVRTVLSRSKMKEFLASHLEVLIISPEGDFPTKSLTDILPSLRKIKTLVLGRPALDLRRTITSAHFQLAPARISLYQPRVLPNDQHFGHPVFKNVTHLELWWQSSRSSWEGWDWASLEGLSPHLTHLCFSLRETIVPSTVELVNSKRPVSVRVFIVCTGSEILVSGQAPSQFENLPVQCRGTIESWGGSPSNGIDLWIMAEELLQAKEAMRNSVSTCGV